MRALSKRTLGWLLIALSGASTAGPAFGQQVEADGQVRVRTERLPFELGTFRPTQPSDLLLIYPELLGDLVQTRLPAVPGLSELADLFARAQVADRREPVQYLDLAARALVRGRIGGPVWGQLGLDTGLISYFVTQDGSERVSDVTGDGLPIDVHARETWFIGETFVELQPDQNGVVLVRCGKIAVDEGWGAIYRTYALGCEGDVQLRYRPDPIPLGFRLFAGLPSGRFNDELKNSPLLSFETTIQIGRPVELGLLGTVFFDQADALAPILAVGLNRSLVECPSCFGDLSIDQTPFFSVTDTQGVVGWLGTRLRWFAGTRASLTVLGILGVGRSNVGSTLTWRRNPGQLVPAFVVTPQQTQVNLLSGLGRVEGEVWWGAFRTGMFGLFATGDGDTGRDGTYGGFVSLAPVLPLTSIFLQGATAPLQQAPSLQTLAPFGAGLGSAGLELDFVDAEFGLGATGALFFAPVPAPVVLRETLEDPPREHFLGGEVDLRARWSPVDALDVTAEGGVFLPGPFFAGVDGAWQLVVGVRGRVR